MNPTTFREYIYRLYNEDTTKHKYSSLGISKSEAEVYKAIQSLKEVSIFKRHFSQNSASKKENDSLRKYIIDTLTYYLSEENTNFKSTSPNERSFRKKFNELLYRSGDKKVSQVLYDALFKNKPSEAQKLFPDYLSKEQVLESLVCSITHSLVQQKEIQLAFDAQKNKKNNVFKDTLGVHKPKPQDELRKISEEEIKRDRYDRIQKIREENEKNRFERRDLSDEQKFYNTPPYTNAKKEGTPTYINNISKQVEAHFSDKISDVAVSPNAYNRCREELLNREQQAPFPKERNYNVNDDMFAYMAIGNKRKNQEDSCILLTHPKYSKFKLLAVADGMGGHGKGEEASYFVLKEITEWFENLNPAYYSKENTLSLQKKFNEQIAKISKNLYNKYKEEKRHPGSTFVGGIITENNAIVSSVGDSKACFYGTDRKIHTITEEENTPNVLLKAGLLKDKDQLRFHIDSNKILNGMGIKEEIYDPVQSYLIPNDRYHCLIFCSDGVSDLISDENMQMITYSTSPELLAKRLVEIANTRDSKNPNKNYDPSEYYGEILAGKDNATAAVFVNNDDGR